MQTMVNACSTQPAKIFNMYPRKGAIAVGSDADIVIYDPSFTGTFTQEDSFSKIDYCGYEGMERRGRADVVLLRGQKVAESGKFVGELAGGNYINR
jgi:dihydropyrimidinase